MARRSTNETRMNVESSRSHAVLTLHLESSTRTDSGLLAVRSSRLNLIDLAGMIGLLCSVVSPKRWQLHGSFLASVRSVRAACSYRVLQGMAFSHEAHDSTADGGHAHSELMPHAQAVSGTSLASPPGTGSERPAPSISP